MSKSQDSGQSRWLRPSGPRVMVAGILILLVLGGVFLLGSGQFAEPISFDEEWDSHEKLARTEKKDAPDGQISLESSLNSETSSPDPPSIRAGQYLNTTSAAVFVSTSKCAECHPDQHESYLKTAHSQALAEISLEDEPPDGEFAHPLSPRSYQIFRRDGKLWHRESWRSPENENPDKESRDKEPIVLAEHPARYVMGSGRFARSYLVEIDGYLMESPISWFTAKDSWGMSPGYERTVRPPGFSRPARFGCVHCHSGHVESVDGALHRLRIYEQAIGCESCHGPGSLHVQKHTASSLEKTGAAPIQEDISDTDFTIVHPGRLSREKQEAICAACHFSSAAQVNVRGRSIADFRPGLSMADFRVHYQLKARNGEMTVVGHTEQMRLSRCYQESQQLTCTTCHDPHHAPDLVRGEREKAAQYRQTCMTCHQVDSCGLAKEDRLAKSDDDNCLTCHMPQTATDILHFAFTHHRIGIHEPTSGDTPHDRKEVSGELEPFENLNHLSSVDQDRCLGLAYLQLAEKANKPYLARRYGERATRLLEDVYRRGVRDAEVLTALAKIQRRKNPAQAVGLAKSALQENMITPITQADAMAVLSRTYVDLGETQSALGVLDRLKTVRLSAEDYFMSAVFRQQSLQLKEAAADAEKAISIAPDQPQLWELASHLQEELGNPQLAAERRQRAELLRSFSPHREQEKQKLEK